MCHAMSGLLFNGKNTKCVVQRLARFFFENKKNFSSHLNKFYSGRNDFSPLSIDYLKKQRKNKSALFV